MEEELECMECRSQKNLIIGLIIGGVSLITLTTCLILKHNK